MKPQRILILGGTFIMLAAFGCRKSSISVNSKVHTREMAGMHHWVGQRRDYGRFGINVSQDTTFAVDFDEEIVVLNDSTIITPGLSNDTLYFTRDTAGSILFAYSKTYYSLTPGAPPGDGKSIGYNYSYRTFTYYAYSSWKGTGSTTDAIAKD
ncbi:MAG: hypothetical protein V4649_09020 [Bacteroidota bacterium]